MNEKNAYIIFLQKSNEIKKVNKKYKYILKKITTKNTYIKYIIL